jgi:hypothetical protein
VNADVPTFYSKRERLPSAGSTYEWNMLNLLSFAEAIGQVRAYQQALAPHRWNGDWGGDDQELRHREEILCCFLPAIQESTSLKDLHINFPLIGRIHTRLGNESNELGKPLDNNEVFH